MATTISYEDSSSGVLTSTTYVESTTSDTLPDRQVIPIFETVSYSSSATDEEQTAVLNAFFGSQSRPELWIDCMGGEVITAEFFTGKEIPVMCNAKPSAGALGDPSQYMAALEIRTSVAISHRLRDGSWTATGGDVNRVSTNIRTFQKSQHRIAVNGNEPKRFVVPGNVTPYCSVIYDEAASMHICQKQWGYLYSDSYMEREVQEVNPDTKAISWKKVFQTLGKVIKVVAEVAKVVIPFALSFAAREEQRTCPVELEPLVRRMAQRTTAPLNRHSSNKRKRSSDSGKSASKKAKASKKSKVSKPSGNGRKA